MVRAHFASNTHCGVLEVIIGNITDGFIIFGSCRFWAKSDLLQPLQGLYTIKSG
jgi:hypothetical protein